MSSLMRYFYSIDSLGVTASQQHTMGIEEERALKKLEENTHLADNGHYESGLLWRYDEFELPESYDMAKKRLICMERKISRQPELQTVFDNTINEYIQKGYIRQLKDNKIKSSQRVWYLPTFAVFNKNKPKARVVWDAAAKVRGVSLNSFLLKRPDLIASLPAILLRFRQRRAAMAADIQQMFHQIFIRKEDRNAQRFLWRFCDSSQEPNVYIMNVMIFGAACSPCTSQYVKNTNALRFENSHPNAAKAIINNHYVDDYLDSVDEIDGAITLAEGVKHIHSQGGFNIRNWYCNYKEVLQALNENATLGSVNMINENQSEKVLGVIWIPSEDVITFKLSPASWQLEISNGEKSPTKRQMLSIVMSIFDPLGLINNILIYGRILLQEVWRSNINWDEEIPSNHLQSWKKWAGNLAKLQNIRIPRCYLKHEQNYDGAELQLHTFVDASENAYAAVSYIRVCKNDNVECALIGSKVRVAPLKPLSIPRLELMAALRGARYAKHIIESHSIYFHKKLFWSDSRTVISWLGSDSRRHHQFVAFRICEILDTSDRGEWQWIPTKLNVADEATKPQVIAEDFQHTR